ncbi:hypothetical protein C2E23DRAFT_739006 [Lenzites betulinus]|nr:hypothetical protein C2E23DRAFT_739006 [Lenzites betulinus]
MRTHLTIHGAVFTAVNAGADTSDWVSATINVVEMRDPAASPNTAHWGINVHVSSQRTHTLYLTGTEWVIHWEEAIDMVTFLRHVADEPSVRYCVLITDRTDFLRLVYYCANIRMYLYNGCVTD